MALSQEALAAFERDGFLAVDQLISGDEVVRIRDILTRLHDNNVGFKEGAQYDAGGPDGDVKARRFPQMLNPHIYAKTLLKGEYFNAASVLAKQILGNKARFKGDISFMKPARIGSVTPWHQDEAFGNPAFDTHEISIWLALTPAHKANSCMAFVPGSHQIDVLPHQPMDGDPRNHALECIGDFDQSQIVECELEAGGCTVHTARTLHRAGPNTSDQTRLAYVLEFEREPTLRSVSRVFPWQAHQDTTDHIVRTRQWVRRGGFIVLLWRKRRHLTMRRFVAEIRRRARGAKF